MKKIVLFLAFCTTFVISNAQSWVDVWQDENTSFVQKQEAFNTFYQGKDVTQIKGWKPFKRWEYFYQRRINNGDLATAKQKALEYFNLQSNSYLMNTTATTSYNGNWSFIGPSQTPTSGGGAGRVNCVEFDNSANPFVGAPAGGLWKKTGTNWATNTDQLSYLGISDILINPTNNNQMYAATGDADNADAICIGVIKSLDGGLTWNNAGLTSVSRIYKLMYFPTDFNKLIAATNNGVWYTSNGGTTWTQSTTGGTSLSAYDMEFKPDNSNIIYMVSANNFWTSTDGGISFNNTGVAAGLPTTGNNRRAIAVTPANAEYVYLLCSSSAAMIGGGSGSGFHSFWRSTNGGGTFTKTLDGASLNILGWSTAGTDISAGGQGWYDLSIAAHPTDANIVYTGGVNVWRTIDGGSSWAINGHWTGGGGVPYVHADIHGLDFRANGDLYCSSDGGLFLNNTTTSSPTWTDLSNGLQIAQMYRFGVSQTNDGLVITGWQDNGTNLRNSSTSNWRRVLGGDGFESAIDPTNANIMFGELYYGGISKSTNGGTSFGGIVSSGGAAGTVNEQGPWLTNFVLAKSNPQIMYVGKTNVYRNSNGGSGGLASWSNGIGIPSSGSIFALAVAPTNENMVYASKGGTMYVATDGINYELKSTGLPGSTITYIAVGSNPNTAYATVNGGAGSLVYKTINGGTSWTNISGSLPAISPQCIAIDETSTVNQLYVGHLNGIYTKNDTLTNWVAFDNLLPNTEVTELEIVYSANKIKAATYGRGAWESDLFSNTAAPCISAPIANFTSNVTEVCVGGTVNYTNATTSCTGTATYAWTFAGGTPANATATNQSVVYNTPGTYTVTLTATNTNGNNTKTSTNLILVKPSITQTAAITASKTTICSNEVVTYNFTGTNNGTGAVVSWFKNAILQGNGSSINLSGLANNDVISASVAAGTSTTFCISNATATSNTIIMNVTPQPPKPIITQVVGDLLSSAAAGNQWFAGGNLISGATNSLYHPILNGVYTVQANVNGCISPLSDPFNLQIEGINNLFPVPSNGNMTFDIYAPQGITNYTASLFSTVGELVRQDVQTVSAGLNRISLKWKGLASGVYNLKVQIGDKNYTKRIVIRP